MRGEWDAVRCWCKYMIIQYLGSGSCGGRKQFSAGVKENRIGAEIGCWGGCVARLLSRSLGRQVGSLPAPSLAFWGFGLWRFFGFLFLLFFFRCARSSKDKRSDDTAQPKSSKNSPSDFFALDDGVRTAPEKEGGDKEGAYLPDPCLIETTAHPLNSSF